MGTGENGAAWGALIFGRKREERHNPELGVLLVQINSVGVNWRLGQKASFRIMFSNILCAIVIIKKLFNN
jgi:hypothetical protein